ncbi:MAG TPA: sigma-54 dependent transcriptional regulator [Gemmatimonadales bacterium]|nr:sigma-54 dependent transcriptional regulator [Gemmatimonadales bacterium]
MASRLPQLTLVRLSDSFAAIWPELASECGLDLVMADSGQEEAPTPARLGGITAINVAGSEGTLGSVLSRLSHYGQAVAAVGASADHRVAMSAVRAGATEYFALPQDYELLRSWLLQRADQIRAADHRESFAASEAAKYRFDDILGESPALRKTLEQAARVIPHAKVNVLIRGETGTGKELLARAVHYNGLRRAAPFVDVNCAAIPDQLLESELFGHEKGAFTGATSAKPGLFELANRGTIFLDEIGHLSLQLQGKLLRVLEQRTIRRVGGTTMMPVDVRVIAATHVDLAAAARRGEFREDLYYRLNVVELALPPLRDRRADIPLLADTFLTRFARDYSIPKPVLSQGALRALQMHSWSGNIRELRNVLERAILLGRERTLEAEHLGLEAQKTAPPSGGALPFPATMAEITRGAALAMVRLCNGNKSEAARRLAISRTRLLRLLAGRDDSDTDDL